MRFFLTFILFLFSILQVSSQALDCTNWLNLPSYPSRVAIGDLDIAGDKLTVEALIKLTSTYDQNLTGGGDVVSKHTNQSDCNYLLRPNGASITTTTGFKSTPAICLAETNITYHIAMVYDGAKLIFYRDGFKMSEVAATGSLIQSNIITSLGLYSFNGGNTNFIGQMNNVRIWNTARTQQQIRQNMFLEISNPASEPNLVGCYYFDNLTNKKGLTQYNGSLIGGASINSNNSNCSAIIDSCGVVFPPQNLCDLTCFWKTSGNIIGSGGNNIFGTIDNSPIRIFTNNTQRGLITNNGLFGWNVTSPTANLHTNGTVRFENLPSGNGNALVVDNQGNVKVAQSIIYRSSDTAINSEIAKLKEEINELRVLVNQLVTKGAGLNTGSNTKSYLLQNNPNPATSSVAVGYVLQSNFREAMINVYDPQGRKLRSQKLTSNTGTITFDVSDFSKGIYVYSLFVENQIVDSKKMIIN